MLLKVSKLIIKYKEFPQNFITTQVILLILDRLNISLEAKCQVAQFVVLSSCRGISLTKLAFNIGVLS